jgi:HEAT repeat protein
MADSKPDVAALIAQMPDTDQQKLNPNDAKAVNTASKVTGPEPVDAEKAFAAILAGGRESILELLGALRDPSDADFKDYKAGYVLHGLCLMASAQGKDEQRRVLAEAMASQLKESRHSTAAKQILIRQLQVVGGKESVPALGECLANADLCDSAVQALIAIRVDASGPLRQALGSVNGRSLVAVIQALGALDDMESLPALRKLLTRDETDIRRSAAVALSTLGDAESADAILKFADAAADWERTHATGLCLVLAEKLAAAGQKDRAVAIYSHLRDTRKDPEEKHVSEAASRALESLKQ